MWLTIVLILLIVLFLWKLGGYNHGHFKKLGIPGPSPLPYLGSFREITKKGLYGLDVEWKNKYGKVYGHYMGSVPILVIHDLELIRQICIKEAHNFTDRQSLRMAGFPLDKAITILRGGEWKRVRKILTPTFTAGKIKKMTPLIHNCVKVLQQRFLQAAENHEDVDTKMYFGGFTIDVIASAFFGLQSTAQENPNDEFYSMSRKFFQVSFYNPFLLLTIFWPKFVQVMKFFRPNGFQDKNVNDYFLKIIGQALDARREISSQDNHHDFLALMLQARFEPKTDDQSMPEQMNDGIESMESTTSTLLNASDKKWSKLSHASHNGLSEHEMLAQAMIFMLAGFDTTARTLNFCAYFLAKYPHYQDKCIKEIQDNLNGELPNYENVSKLPWLDLCIQETLRLVPPAQRFDRVANQSITLTDSQGKQIFIPKGQACAIALHGIQCDSQYWDNPMEYNPSRFDNGELERHKRELHFIPFGVGPRNCIGMRFAQLELKVALAHVLSAVRFVQCDKTVEKLNFNASNLVDPLQPIILRVEKI